MKKVILLFHLLVLCQLGTTQILFEQDFSNDSIAPMTSIDRDGFTPRYDMEHIGYAWKAIRGRAYATSRFEVPNQAENWLITPAIPITKSNTFLKWYSSSSFHDVTETYKVLVSTTSTELNQFTKEILKIGRAGVREYHALKLDDFLGDTIYIAFLHQTYNGRVLSLDDIVVEVQKEGDVSGKINMDVNTYPFYKENQTPMDLDIFIHNDSGEDIANAALYYINKDEEKLIGLIENISYTKHLIPKVVSEDQSEEEEIIVLLRANDGTLLSSAKTTVQILNNSPKKRMLIEENSATWCGGCPRASIFFDQMKLDHAGDYIGIAIHEQDTMSLKLTHKIGSYPKNIRGIPSLSFDRFFHHVNPDDAEAYFILLQETLANPFDLRVETVYNEEDRTVTINAYTSSIIDLNNYSDRFRISSVLTEDKVSGTTSNFAQANWYSDSEDLINASGTVNWKDLPNPVPASEMIYNKVLRAMLTPYYGKYYSLPSAIEKGEEYLYSMEYKIPLEFDPNTSNIVVIIKDTRNGASINVASTPVISETTALHEIGQYEIDLYPNPIQEQLIIKQNSSLPLEYKMFSVDGKTLLQGILDAQNTIVNTSTLPKGIYFLEIRNNKTHERIIEKIEKL